MVSGLNEQGGLVDVPKVCPRCTAKDAEIARLNTALETAKAAVDSAAESVDFLRDRLARQVEATRRAFRGETT